MSSKPLADAEQVGQVVDDEQVDVCELREGAPPRGKGVEVLYWRPDNQE